MSLQYIRNCYGVPAKRGGRIVYGASDGEDCPGRIIGAKGARLRVRFDYPNGKPGDRTALLHPTWNVVYL